MISSSSLCRLFTRSALVLCLGTQANGQGADSVLTVPISVPLGNIQAYVEGLLPGTLHSNEYGRTCVEPERACTRVPEFRGLEVTFRNRCIEITPRIDCTVTERVAREGPIRISGSGDQLTIVQDIYGTGTVRGRGEIGSHIRQTVRARAEFTILASPALNADWTPSLGVNITYRWIDRPQFNLFNLIPVSMGSTLGPPLDAAIANFQNTTLPNELAAIDLRGDIAALWSEIQDPLPIALSADHFAYLHIQPTAVGIEGPSYAGDQLSAQLGIAFRAWINEAEGAGGAETPLPNLSPVNATSSRIVVPARIRLSTIEEILAQELPISVEFETPVEGRAVVSSVALAGADDRLVINIGIDFEPAEPSLIGSGLQALSGDLRLEAVPVLDVNTQEISLSALEVMSNETGVSAAIRTAALQVVEPILERTLALPLGRELERLSEEIDAAFASNIAPPARFDGAVDVRVLDFGVIGRDRQVEAVLEIQGNVQIVGFQPLQ